MLLPSYHHVLKMNNHPLEQQPPAYDTVQSSDTLRDHLNLDLCTAFSHNGQSKRLKPAHRPGWAPNPSYFMSLPTHACTDVRTAHDELQRALQRPDHLPIAHDSVSRFSFRPSEQAPVRQILPAPRARRPINVGFPLRQSYQGADVIKDVKPRERRPAFNYIFPSKVSDPLLGVQRASRLADIPLQSFNKYIYVLLDGNRNRVRSKLSAAVSFLSLTEVSRAVPRSLYQGRVQWWMPHGRNLAPGCLGVPRHARHQA